MTTRAFQKVYTKIDNITKATVTLRASGVGNDELATVGGKLAQVVKIMGENVTLQIFAGTEGLSTDSEVVFHGEPPKLRVSDNLAGRFFNAYGEPLEGGGIIEGGFGILRIIPVDCSEEYFGLNVFFFEFRS